MGGFKLAYLFVLSSVLYFAWFISRLAKRSKTGQVFNFKRWWLVIFILIIIIGIFSIATGNDITDFIR